MTSFWNSEPIDKGYFADRSENPYRSTVSLEYFLRQRGFFEERRIADVACGTGSEAAFLARRYPDIQFVGFDLNSRFINAAKMRYSSIQNLSFHVVDLNELPSNKKFNECTAVWFSQTLSWLDWWEGAVQAICPINIKRVGLSTLSWPMEMESEVIHYLEGKSVNPDNYVKYNVLSIEKLMRRLASFGLENSSYEKFEIDINIDPLNKSRLGSYTLETQVGERLIFSAWQAMPLYNFYFERIF